MKCFVESTYFRVLSQLPVTRRFISEIHEMLLIGASCMPTVTAWPPDSMGHIFACLSQPPENTVLPSSFQAEHKTYKVHALSSTTNSQMIHHYKWSRADFELTTRRYFTQAGLCNCWMCKISWITHPGYFTHPIFVLVACALIFFDNWKRYFTQSWTEHSKMFKSLLHLQAIHVK